MDGGDRAGFMQVAESVDSVLITSTMGAASATDVWISFEVISSAAQFVGITAAGLINSSLIDSGTTFHQNAVFACSKITMIHISADTDGSSGQVIAHKKVLL